MKTKFVLSLLLIVLLAAFCGCANKKATGNESKLPEEFAFLNDTFIPGDAVLPPAAAGSFEAQYARLFSVKENYQMHDNAAIVTVGDWLYEDESASYYQAKVERALKGELPESIVLAQIGNSQSAELGFPLLSCGEKLLVFLNEWGKPGHEGKNEYEVDSLTAMFIAPDSDGSVWLVDVKGLIGTATEGDPECSGIENSAGNAALVKELKGYLASFDPAFEGFGADFVCRFSEAEAVFAD